MHKYEEVTIYRCKKCGTFTLPALPASSYCESPCYYNTSTVDYNCIDEPTSLHEHKDYYNKGYTE